MTKKQILAHSNALFSSLLKQHRTFCTTQSAEALHQMRLAYKKLNALLYFFTEDRKHVTTTKEFKKLRKLYLRTGKIRDAQMSIQLLQRVSKTATATTKSKQLKAGRQTEQLRKRCTKDTEIISNARERTNSFLKAVPDEVLLQKFGKVMGKVKAQLSPGTRSEKNLHASRKLMKRLGYAGKMLTPALQQKANLPYKHLKKTESTIGHWHDALVLHTYLQKHKRSKKEIKKLEEIKGTALHKAVQHIQLLLQKD